MSSPTGYALFAAVFLTVYLLALCIHRRPRGLRDASGEHLCAVRCVAASVLLAGTVAAAVHALGSRLQRCRRAGEGECSLR